MFFLFLYFFQLMLPSKVSRTSHDTKQAKIKNKTNHVELYHEKMVQKKQRKKNKNKDCPKQRQ